MDLSRLTKLLALTASDSDGEALNAIRAANALLKKHNLSWCQVITITVPNVVIDRTGEAQRRRGASAFDDEFMEILRQAKRQQQSQAQSNLREKAAREAAARQAQANGTTLYDLMLRMCIEHYRGQPQQLAILENIRGFFHKNGYLTQGQRELLERFWNIVKETK